MEPMVTKSGKHNSQDKCNHKGGIFYVYYKTLILVCRKCKKELHTYKRWEPGDPGQEWRPRSFYGINKWRKKKG